MTVANRSTVSTASAPPARVSLTDPIELPCGQRIPNRLTKAALSECLGDPTGAPGEKLVRLYEQWSHPNGCGLMITGNVMIDRRHFGEPGNIAVEDGRDIALLEQWAAVGKAGGNRLWMQLNHPGRQANALIRRNRPVAPSAIPADMPGAIRPRGLTDTEIEEIIARFATTAAIAQLAGFDGVQLHGAHGYLISQFLSPLSNRRTDDWGGALENRMRFLVETVRAVRAAVGPRFPLAIKLNSADFQRGGFDEHESMAVVNRLALEGVDLVEVSGGNFGSPAMMGKTVPASTRQREAYFQSYAEEVRMRVPHMPLMLTGGFRTLSAMQSALDGGACDLIGLGRALCVDPATGIGLLQGTITRAPVEPKQLGMRRLLGRVTDLRAIDGILDLQWHTDQIHRLAAGLPPDLDRTWQQALFSMIRRNGLGALRRRRGF